MSDSPQPSPSGKKGLGSLGGVLLIIAALGGFAYTGHSGWQLYQQVHANPKNAAALMSTSALAPIAGGLFAEIFGLLFGVKLLRGSGGKAAAGDNSGEHAGHVGTTVSTPSTARRNAKRWNSCNVIQVTPDHRKLWGFNASRGGFSLSQQLSIPTAEPLPAGLVARDWKTVFQPRLNIAWLPVEQVFLRVTQLPLGSFEETLSMVELQLEKLSPLPVTQIVWSIQILPHGTESLQTVIVVIVSRGLVEELLGRLEAEGYVAEQLELPMLDQLLATKIMGDGAWVYSGTTNGNLTALVAWWYGGTLRSLGLLRIPATENRDAVLKEQLTQMAWSGEIEGWLTKDPAWHLVADETAAAQWQPMFRAWLGHPVEVTPPLPEPQLAALTARRAARAEPRANILPVEFAQRYRQEFIDRLWLRGLMGILLIYGFGVLIYFAVLQVQNYRTDELATQVSSHSLEYTNVLQLKAQLDLLLDRKSLQYASLNCWRKTAELLPEGVTLNSMEFRNGRTLVLNGTAPADERGMITDFNEAMRKATHEGAQMFDKVDAPSIKLTGNTLNWNFNAELARYEEVSQ